VPNPHAPGTRTSPEDGPDRARDGTQPDRPGRSSVLLGALVFAVSATARAVWMVSGSHNFDFVDLRVYVMGASRLSTGRLYDFAVTAYTPDQPLPFTYPPFAAMVFYPLHLMPFAALAWVWVVVTIALQFVALRLALGILRPRSGVGTIASVWSPRIDLALFWTGVCLWLEPARSNLDEGQINILLMALGLLSAALVLGRSRTRQGLAGALVGIAAGIKLTPAVGGLFLAARRSPLAVCISVLAFGASVAVGWLAAPIDTARYFSVALADISRVGNPAKIDNQSLRGALSRIAGHDVGLGPIWMFGTAVVVVVTGVVWWKAGRSDVLLTLLLAQFLGLLVSPISWIHHWVWLSMGLVWLAQGPARGLRCSKVVLGVWLAVLAVGVRALPAVLGVSGLDRDVTTAVGGIAYVVLWAGLLAVAFASRPRRVPCPSTRA
jgi:alpha-1,2-mannosyltransferase